MGGRSQLLGGATAPPVDLWARPLLLLHRPPHLLAPPRHQGARMQVASRAERTMLDEVGPCAHNPTRHSAHRKSHLLIISQEEVQCTNPGDVQSLKFNQVFSLSYTPITSKFPFPFLIHTSRISQPSWICYLNPTTPPLKRLFC